MPILKIQPNAISNTESFVFGNVTTTSITANGVNLGTAVAEAFVLANNANKSTTSDTAPANPKVGDSWFDTVTNVLLRYTNDGVSNNWIDISGPQNAGYIFQSYSLSSNTTSLNETTSNTSVALTVSTINIADGTTLYWTISGSTGPDFTDGSNSGSVSITNNSGTFTRTLTADVTTEGVESFVAQLRTGSTSGPIVAIAPVITVADTSMAPVYALYSWGRNENGALGLNSQDSQSNPTQVGTGTIWLEASAGKYHTLAIKTDGTLWAWGKRDFGQLGLNNASAYGIWSPTQVGAGTTWSSCSAGYDYSLAVKSDGTLWAWGTGLRGVLGVGNIINRSSPTQVGSDTTWLRASASQYSTVAIKTNGTIWGWGGNFVGQLGTNNSITRSSPVQIGTGTDWQSIVQTDYTTTFAIKTNGSLWGWGDNFFGIVNVDKVSKSSPVQIGSLTNWASVAEGSYYDFAAVKTNGTLWVSGQNNYGKLGLNIPSATYRSSPTQVGTDTNWSKVNFGGNLMIALKTNGTIWSCGYGFAGTSGLNEFSGYRSSPVQIGTNTNWGKITTGPNHSLAITLS